MGDGGGGSEDFEYAELSLILTKVIKVPSKNKLGQTKNECAYVDGITGDLYNSIT